jgi:ribonuclease Z
MNTPQHGDHIYGLPGLLCSMSSAHPQFKTRFGKKADLEIVGPVGLAQYIRTSLLISGPVHLSYTYRVTELVIRDSFKNRLGAADYRERLHPQEIRGEIIKENGDGVFSDIFDDNHLRVRAARLNHTVPCVGYVIEEKNASRGLNGKYCTAILRKHYEALLAQGIQQPYKLMEKLKVDWQQTLISFPLLITIMNEHCIL